MPGILNLNKPRGMTSRHAVNVIDRLSPPEKSGHAGTLDPLASGVLIVLRRGRHALIQYVQDMPKSYLGTFLLGRSSPTDDLEGAVTEFVAPPQPTRDAIVAATRGFVGPIQQRPRRSGGQGGRPAGVRSGPPRPDARVALATVTVYELTVVEYEYPQLTLEVACSGGGMSARWAATWPPSWEPPP